MATKSRFFRVATEGATTDGRAIEKKWIEQMAKNFDPKKYGARIWLEHYRGIAPEGLFKAYGDVLALEARAVDGGKLALFAQIEPLPELVAMTKAKQKIYTSIEVNPSFADTGEAYMTGLGVTDSPASLGTDVLTFAAQNPKASPFAGRKENDAILFSEAVEAEFNFEDTDDTDAGGTKFSEVLKGVLAKFKKKGQTDDARFSDVVAGFEQLGQTIQEQADEMAEQAKAHDKLASDFAALKKAHDDMAATLEKTPSHNHTQRPPAAGGSGVELTQF
ncbi:MAG: GPO family capsid scaffolding protein [Acidovorax sp.]|uniref:GPO family capsid scaffolding protein n=1 Tax=Acidovorax sp. TaxID=1872122 RepID=UPI00391C0AFF